MTVLIIEGPDLSGKSYAIEKIGKSFKRGMIIKNLYKPTKYPDSEIYTQYYRIWKLNELLVLMQGKRSFLILDRFFPSQAVYSYMRGQDEMFSDEIKELDKQCADDGFILVYLDTPLEKLETRFDERGDEHIKKEDLYALKARYDTFFEISKMHKVRIDTLEEGWLEKLRNFVEETENGN
jgi:thymidylate kinase